MNSFGARFSSFGRSRNIPPAVRAAAAASGASPYEIVSLDFANQQYWRQGVRSSFGAIPGESSSGGVNGTIETASGIVPATEENLLTYSEDFTNAAWVKSDFGTGPGAPTVTEYADPEGGSDKVFKVEFPAVGVGEQSALAQVVTSAGVDMTGSIEIKADGDIDIIFRAVDSTEEVISITQSWKNFSRTIAGGDLNGVQIKVRPNAGGTSGPATVYVRRPHVRRASTSDTYVKTEGSAITRAAPRINTAGSRGLVVEGAATNKCEAFAAPTDLTGVTRSGDAASTVAVVDDAAKLAAAGLSGITSGKAYKLDNSAGSSDAFMTVAGVTGNTNAHTVLAYVRCSGTIDLYTVFSSAARLVDAGEYIRTANEGQTPSSSANTLVFRVFPGAVGYLVLPQLEEASTVSTYIPTAGSAVTRTADSITLDMSDLGLASDQEWAVTYADGSTGTLNAVADTLTFPASTKVYASAYAVAP